MKYLDITTFFVLHLIYADFGLVVGENTLRQDVSEKVDELRKMLITNIFYLVLKHGLFYSVLYFYSY